MAFQNQPVRVVSPADSYWKNPEFLKAMGFEDDPADETARYFGEGGDFWYDCDRVKYGGEQLQFNLTNGYAVLNFDPHEFPDHVRLIGEFAKDGEPGFEFIPYSGAWPSTRPTMSQSAFAAAKNAIAYRGGSGYVYGIYLWHGGD